MRLGINTFRNHPTTPQTLEILREPAESAVRHQTNDEVAACSDVRTENYPMCPVCIASTAVIVAGAGSTGGILAVCVGRFRRFFRANVLTPIQKTKEK
jgi:hypothetical protein